MVYGFSPFGAMGLPVRVEVDIRRGLPGTDIVGLASSEVREARERVRVAIRNSGFEYPSERILISLSPAEVPKIGAGFDLAIALAVLEQSGQVTLPGDVLASGELSIQGDVVPVRGTLSAVLSAEELGVPHVVVARRAVRELYAGKAAHGGLLVVDTLGELKRGGFSRPEIEAQTNREREAVSFDDIRGQPALKWASAVAAAGFHNLLLVGPPGSGKTMAARRLSSLLPDMPDEHARVVARIYSMRGLEGGLSGSRPPVRMPHHSASMEGLLGGGKGHLPGEVSLSHLGIMILDEAAEFRPHVLQALREPVERRSVTVSRAGLTEEFPAQFQLVLTSNLCPCGKLGRPESRCMCSDREVERYWRRLGSALLDRVDIRVRTYYRERSSDSPKHADLALSVRRAIERQRRRTVGRPWRRNGLIPPEAVDRLLPLTRHLTSLLGERMKELGLSDRAASSVRSVARTLADMDDRDQIGEGDILEAASLRSIGPE